MVSYIARSAQISKSWFNQSSDLQIPVGISSLEVIRGRESLRGSSIQRRSAIEDNDLILRNSIIYNSNAGIKDAK